MLEMIRKAEGSGLRVDDAQEQVTPSSRAVEGPCGNRVFPAQRWSRGRSHMLAGAPPLVYAGTRAPPRVMRVPIGLAPTPPET